MRLPAVFLYGWNWEKYDYDIEMQGTLQQKTRYIIAGIEDELI